MHTNIDTVWLDNVRIISILCVIVLHVSANVVLEADIKSNEWMIANIIDSFVRWAAPVFIILSGYLLLNPIKNTESISTFYGKRINKIGIALLFWTFFYLLVQAAKNHIKGIEFNISNDILMPIYLGEPYFHLWFMYTIFMLYLLTPLIRIFLNKVNMKAVFVIVIISFAIAMFFNVSINEKSFFMIGSLKYLPYFLAGYLFRFINIQKRYFFISLILFVLSYVITACATYLMSIQNGTVSYYSLYFYSYLSITIVPMSIAIFYILAHLKPLFINTGYSSYVFGVYLIHPIILEIFRFVGLKAESYPPLLSIPIITFSIIYLSLYVVVVIQKTTIMKKITGL